LKSRLLLFDRVGIPLVPSMVDQKQGE